MDQYSEMTVETTVGVENYPSCVHNEISGHSCYTSEKPNRHASSDKNCTMCICTSSVKMELSSEECSGKYKCGACWETFTTLCRLDEHLLCHSSQGYFYDLTTFTAYPKFQTCSSYVQTDLISFDKLTENLECLNNQMPESSPMVDYHVESNTDCSPGKNTTSEADLITEKVKEEKICDESDGVTSKKRTRKQATPSKTKSEVRTCRKGKGNPEKQGDMSTISNQGNVKQETNTVLKKDIKSLESDIYVQRSNFEAADLKKPVKKRKVTVPTDNKLCVEKTKSSKKSKAPKIKTENENTIILSNKTVHEQATGVNSETALKKEQTTDAQIKNTEDDKTVQTKSVETKPAVQRERGRPIKEAVKGKRKVSIQVPKLMQCEVCKVFLPSRKLKSHLFKHSGEKPFVCEVCGKTFARSRFLQKHQITHANVKPHKCELCGREFCQRAEYKLHMAGHEDYRPFLCNVCGKRFLSEKSLLYHQANVHMGVTKFECDVCNKRFFKKSSLNVHKATHFEATLECNHCERKFRDKTALVRHIRTHTGKMRYKCHICDHGFIQSTPFWVHMDRRHNIDRDKLKDKLKDIHEHNRRMGVTDYITMLPADFDNSSIRKEILPENQVKSSTKKTTKQPSKKKEKVVLPPVEEFKQPVNYEAPVVPVQLHVAEGFKPQLEYDTHVASAATPEPFVIEVESVEIKKCAEEEFAVPSTTSYSHKVLQYDAHPSQSSLAEPLYDENTVVTLANSLSSYIRLQSLSTAHENLVPEQAQQLFENQRELAAYKALLSMGLPDHIQVETPQAEDSLGPSLNPGEDLTDRVHDLTMPVNSMHLGFIGHHNVQEMDAAAVTTAETYTDLSQGQTLG